MGEDLPCITLVKMQEIAERPVLTPDEQALEQALSMLCSFLSLEDFISFLQSDKFARLARTESRGLFLKLASTSITQKHSNSFQAGNGSHLQTLQ
jgi:hypothetical protein